MNDATDDQNIEDILKQLDNFQDEVENEFGFKLDGDIPSIQKTEDISSKLSKMDSLLGTLQFKQQEWENFDRVIQENNLTLEFNAAKLADTSSSSSSTLVFKDKVYAISTPEGDLNKDNTSLSTEEKVRNIVADMDTKILLEIDNIHLYNKIMSSGKFSESEDIFKAIEEIKNERRNKADQPEAQIINTSENLGTKDQDKFEEEDQALKREEAFQKEFEEKQLALLQLQRQQLEEQQKLLDEQKESLNEMRLQVSTEEEVMLIEDRQQKLDIQMKRQEEQMKEQVEREKQSEILRSQNKENRAERQRNYEEKKKLWLKSMEERHIKVPDSPTLSRSDVSKRTDSQKKALRKTIMGINNLQSNSSRESFQVSNKELIEPDYESLRSIIRYTIPTVTQYVEAINHENDCEEDSDEIPPPPPEDELIPEEVESSTENYLKDSSLVDDNSSQPVVDSPSEGLNTPTIQEEIVPEEVVESPTKDNVEETNPMDIKADPPVGDTLSVSQGSQSLHVVGDIDHLIQNTENNTNEPSLPPIENPDVTFLDDIIHQFQTSCDPVDNPQPINSQYSDLLEKTNNTEFIDAVLEKACNGPPQGREEGVTEMSSMDNLLDSFLNETNL